MQESLPLIIAQLALALENVFGLAFIVATQLAQDHVAKVV